MKFLVSEPASLDFLDRVKMPGETHLSIILGDPEKVEPHSRPHLLNARAALRQGVDKIAALAEDPTRTEVARHGAAKKVADATIKVLAQAKTELECRADFLSSEALREIESDFGLNPQHAQLESELRAYVRELMKTDEGPVRLRKVLGESEDLARVVFNSPPFLLGVPESFSSHWQEIRMEVLEQARPEMFAKLGTAVNLRKTAAKFEPAIDRVRRSFYNSALASAASRRVDVA